MGRNTLRRAMEASIAAKREFLERLDQLEVFDAAARHGSFVRAA